MSLQRNDHVIVVKGEQRNVTGHVLMVVEKFARVAPDPSLKLTQRSLNIPVAYLRKIFKEGY